MLMILVGFAWPARADEGGVSFWLPGQQGSFAAVPGVPGLTVPVLGYHSSVNLTGSRQLFLGGNVALGVGAAAGLLLAFPTYVFAPTVAGGQLSLGAGFGFGHLRVTADIAAEGAGGAVLNRTRTDSVTGVSDLYPSAMLKWNGKKQHGLVYLNGGVPVGAYKLGRLANIGINHWSIDGGGGFTYLDPEKGHELSVVGGVTYNFENPDTNYQNGVDSHIDAGAAQFVNEQLYLGLVGYAYVQLSDDSGAPAVLGDVKSRVLGVGPQAGFTFDVGGQTWATAFKANYEFAAKDRPSGWNTFVTLVIPVATATPPKATPPKTTAQ